MLKPNTCGTCDFWWKQERGSKYGVCSHEDAGDAMEPTEQDDHCPNYVKRKRGKRDG